MVERRLLNALVSMVVALFFVGIAWLIAQVVKRAFGRSIGSSRYYAVAFVLGIALNYTLPALWINSPVDTMHPTSGLATVATEKTGLDVPFIAPKEAELEQFPGQLERAIQMLSTGERAKVQEAIGFLAFAVTADLMDKNPKSVDSLSDVNIAAESLLRLWRFAQKQGGSMTLRKYIDLAEEFKKQKPQWWRQYTATLKK
jgi:hypothetical protein